MADFDIDALVHCLIGGMRIEDFDRGIRERKTTKFAAAIESAVVDELFNLSRLESLLRNEASLTSSIDVFDEAHLRRLVDMQRKSGKSTIGAVADNFRQGSTIRIRDVDQFDTRLSRLAIEVRRRFMAQSDINIYLTPPAKTGFPAHFDITDVFIIQCLGAKEWRIFHDYTNKTELPLPQTNWDPDRFRPSGPAEAITLRRGDVLYLPRGTMHQAFCTDRESMHLTISVAPLTYADLLFKALKLAAENDVELRRRVPWSIDTEDHEYEEAAKTVRSYLMSLTDQIELKGMISAEHRSVLGEEGTHSASELESAIANLLKNVSSQA